MYLLCPCLIKRCSYGVDTALLRTSHCVLSRFYGVLAGDSKRLHDIKIFTVLALRSWCVHCVSIAFPRRSHPTSTVSAFWHCADGLWVKRKGRLCHLYVFFSVKNLLWHQSVKMTILKTSGCLQAWPDPKHSLRPAPSESLQNYAGSICSKLYLPRMHSYK